MRKFEKAQLHVKHQLDQGYGLRLNWVGITFALYKHRCTQLKT
jgi:hypothetical protein